MEIAKIEKYDKSQVANICLKLVTPKLIQGIRAKPKGLFNWTLSTKAKFTSQAIEEILNEPSNAMLKSIINNTAFARNPSTPDDPYHQLAVRLADVI